MSEYCCRIERVKNGYTVEMKDPKIVKQNQASSNKPSPWKDPNVEYVFQTLEQVLDFLKANLDKALPTDDYTTSFDKALTETD
jgi:hypothetical protein